MKLLANILVAIPLGFILWVAWLILHGINDPIPRGPTASSLSEGDDLHQDKE